MRGYNSFAYCSNNPVIYYDPDGESATVLICGIAVSVESIIVWGVGLTVVAISIAYITDPAFRARCDKAISSIIDSFIKGLKSLHCLSTAVINYVGGQIKTIKKKITASFARYKNRYPTSSETHIVGSRSYKRKTCA